MRAEMSDAAPIEPSLLRIIDGTYCTTVLRLIVKVEWNKLRLGLRILEGVEI